MQYRHYAELLKKGPARHIRCVCPTEEYVPVDKRLQSFLARRSGYSFLEIERSLRKNVPCRPSS